jgi:hypothetical protein
MARVGLKRQGTLWGLFHGSEMVSEAVASAAKNGDLSRTRNTVQDLCPAEQEPAYDNDAEYGNLQTALEEAKQHPPLEDPRKQREREKLQAEIDQWAAAFDLKHRKGRATIIWDADAQEELHALMDALMRLLKLVGLCLDHGWAYTGAS